MLHFSNHAKFEHTALHPLISSPYSVIIHAHLITGNFIGTMSASPADPEVVYEPMDREAVLWFRRVVQSLPVWPYFYGKMGCAFTA